MSLSPDFPKDGQEYSPFYNYSKILKDKNFYKACTNNLKYSSAVLLTVLSLSLFLSFLLKNISSSRLRYFYLFCLLLPGLIPPSVMGILFNLVFNGRSGLLNQVFVIPFGFKPVNWIGDPSYIMTSLVIQAVWRWTGFVTLFLLCGFEALPKDTKEAALIDGSGTIRTFFELEIPGIKHIIVFAGAFLLVDSISLFSGSYSLLGDSGGPANAGLVIANYSYWFTSFQQYNAAATVSIMILPVLLFLTFLLCYRRQKS